ncbi:MAG: hypothetical protein JZU55_02585 [Afipia sp.]|nr:hypothetical protein [Afipia sp.]
MMLPWRELTWRERGEMILGWIIATAFGLALFGVGILMLGQMADGVSRYKSERNACLQHATNGLEIEQCR